METAVRAAAATGSGEVKAKRANTVLWVLQMLLAALFLFAGVMKLISPIAELAEQAKLPGGFLRFIGVAEVLGGLGLVLPGVFRVRRVLTPLAAGGLTIIMVGGTVVTAAHGDIGMALIPLAVGVLCAVVMRGRWGMR